MTSPYPKEPISPLRARMIDDMRVRNFALATQRDYIRAVKRLAAYLKRSPDTATAEELRAFQQHLAAATFKPASINITVTALKFFFRVTVDKPETTRRISSRATSTCASSRACPGGGRGSARARTTGHHRALYAGGDQRHPAGDEPNRPALAARRAAGSSAGVTPGDDSPCSGGRGLYLGICSIG